MAFRRPKLRLRTALLSLLAHLCVLGCHRAIIHSTPEPAPSDTYVDLRAGDQLRVTLPYLRSGGFVIPPGRILPQEQVLTVQQDELLGYRLVHHAVEARARNRIELYFSSVETSAPGAPAVDRREPALPFNLPTGRSCLIRLIYFVRSSRADHNTAIATAQNRQKLDALTERLIADPLACRASPEFTCVWVPAGIAVRREATN